MKKSLNEEISALLDDEIDQLSLSRLLAAESDEDVYSKLARHAMTQELLHDRDVDLTINSTEFLQGIHEGIEEESSSNPVSSFWMKTSVGLSVAACMAFVVVFSFDYIQNNNESQVPIALQSLPDSEDYLNDSFQNGQAVNVSLAEQELNDPYQVMVAADQELRKREEELFQAQVENAEMQRRLRKYLIRHAAESRSINNMASFTRASYTPVME
jgi:hypothetical protein